MSGQAAVSPRCSSGQLPQQGRSVSERLHLPVNGIVSRFLGSQGVWFLEGSPCIFSCEKNVHISIKIIQSFNRRFLVQNHFLMLLKQIMIYYLYLFTALNAHHEGEDEDVECHHFHHFTVIMFMIFKYLFYHHYHHIFCYY